MMKLRIYKLDSLAYKELKTNINKVIKFLGYSATHNLSNGLKEAMTWYAEKQKYLSNF